MRYFTLGIHYPEPEHKQDILAVAKEVAGIARSCEGLVETGAWLDEEFDRIIMMSLSESEGFANRARPKLAPLIVPIPWSEWERKPSENMVNLKKALF